MLINEILHKPKVSGKCSILMKLDTIKVFDCLGWDFLYRILAHIGFGPLFISVIRSFNATIASTVLIQGRLTKPFKLEQSLRQRCPLSSFHYLIVANVFSWNLSKATFEGLIKRVHIHETREEYTHSQFVDYTNCIIEARLEYIEATFCIFKEIRNAFGLFIKEQGIKVVLISSQTLPQELQHLDWQCENE